MLEPNRALPRLTENDPQRLLSEEARRRLGAAMAKQEAIRAEALALIHARVRGGDWDGAADEKWAHARIEAAFTVLSVEQNEFWAIDKRGRVLDEIMRERLAAAAYSLEMSNVERDAVWAKLNCASPTAQPQS